jgi:hypothetical protein
MNFKCICNVPPNYSLKRAAATACGTIIRYVAAPASLKRWHHGQLFVQAGWNLARIS